MIKDFITPNLKKLSLCLLFTVLFIITSIKFGIDLSCGCPELPGGCFDGCSFKYNPLLWSPLPIINSRFKYSYGAGGGIPDIVPGNLREAVLVTLPYWFLTSYLFSCLISVIQAKLKRK